MSLDAKQKAVSEDLRALLAKHYPGSSACLLAVIVQGANGIELVTNVKEAHNLVAVCNRIADHVKRFGKRNVTEGWPGLRS